MSKSVSSFGRYPKHLAECHVPLSVMQLESMLALENTSWIPRGLGRSYGDSALSTHIYSSAALNRFIAFDAKTGVLDCQSGVCLADILAVIVPQGWFLPVTSGTKFVTIGGAIASDVHGKNHHQVGAFSAFVDEIELITAEGLRIICSRENQPSIFHATCGGMGLTGFIVRATIRLRKVYSNQIKQQTIKTKNLAETLEILFEQESIDYSVAWLDCTAKESALGRALIFLGEHAKDDALHDFAKASHKKDWPLLSYAAPCLNPYSIKLFNTLYYYGHKQCRTEVSLDQYFYPLDRLPGWNRLYGKNGFTQYQFVVPRSAHQALKKILSSIRTFGACSFLSVLKTFGKQNANYLSFPMEGLTLAIDFKIHPDLWPFLNQLDDQVMAAGGRVYLTKDCRLPSEPFRQMYPRFEEFLAVKRALDPLNKIQSLQSRRLFFR